MVRERTASSDQLEFLFETFANTKNREQVEALMIDLCTIREINEMATRLVVAQMLAAGESYLRIQEATGSSATTIARVSKCINHGAGGYRQVFGMDSKPKTVKAKAPAPSRRRANQPAAGGRTARRSKSPGDGNQTE